MRTFFAQIVRTWRWLTNAPPETVSDSWLTDHYRTVARREFDR